jgi:hypothetical protein
MEHGASFCPECGAPAVNGQTCWEQLGWLLAWEADDAELASQHYFTVVCYNLQHPAQFTDDAVVAMRDGFVDAMDRGLPVPEIRRRAARVFEGQKRVLRDPTDRRPLLRRWRMTIADVYWPDQPRGAAERVRAWAAAIRAELFDEGLPVREPG